MAFLAIDYYHLFSRFEDLVQLDLFGNLFADDTDLSYFGKDWNILQDEIDADLLSIGNRLLKNVLRLNVLKSVYIYGFWKLWCHPHNESFVWWFSAFEGETSIFNKGILDAQNKSIEITHSQKPDVLETA
jgi:hypothetical protein